MPCDEVAIWRMAPRSGKPVVRKHPVDVPWDDPEPLEAMLALRSEA